MSILVEGVAKRFPARGRGEAPAKVLEGVDLSVGAEEIVTVLGPSGCGKSTLLSCIAGLDSYEGSITVDGTPVSEPPAGLAVVFQSAHLLPWRTLEANVRYGLEMQRTVPRSEWKERVDAALALVGLSDFRHHLPRQLSGGMQQRANIARALATRPRVLLMDEPFGALDAITKEHMQEQLQEIAAREKLSILFITHDIGEAIYLGDRVAVMEARPGRVRLVKEIPEGRPRRIEFKRTPEFQAIYEELWATL